MSKVQCVVLAYHDLPTIQKTMDCLMKEDIQLTVIENPSVNTETKLKPYLLDLVKQGKIDQYYLMDENITNNAAHVVYGDFKIDESCDYFIHTDGDITCEGDWLQEEINILDKCPEIFVVSVSLDMSNLPSQHYPDAHTWVPANVGETELYYEGSGAGHFMMLKTQDFIDYRNFQKTSGMKWTDGTIRHFAYKHRNRKFAKTKRNFARHLAWDMYQDQNHPYTIEKRQKTILQLWEHDRVCGYQLFKKGE